MATHCSPTLSGKVTASSLGTNTKVGYTAEKAKEGQRGEWRWVKEDGEEGRREVGEGGRGGGEEGGG